MSDPDSDVPTLSRTPWVMSLLGVLLLLGGTSDSAAQERKTDLGGIGHELGDPDAPVFVVEYADFACGACAQFFAGAWPDIRGEFIETGKVRWKIVPFELGFSNSGEGAHAGECAAAQGMFWEMHDALYEHREAWVTERDPEDELVDLARRTGLDDELFRACYQDERHEDRIETANDAADTDGVRGTPTFYVNGFQVQGALPIDAFRTLLDDASPRP